MLLIISDGINNGKGFNLNYIKFDFHYFVYEPIPNNILQDVKIVLFNYNEALFTYRLNWNPMLRNYYDSPDAFINALQALSKSIKKNYTHITIYNDPVLCMSQSSKCITNKKLEFVKNVRIPKINRILSIEDIDKVVNYPVIIKLDEESHNSGDVKDTLCKDRYEMIQMYRKHFEKYDKTIVVEYMNSYDEKIRNMISVRIIIYKNKIHDIYIRPSKEWNGHNDDQYVENIDKCKLLYLKKLWEYNYDSFLKNIEEQYGYGFFAVDFTYDSEKNELGLCEIGMKFIDDTYYNFMNEHTKTIEKSINTCYNDINAILTNF